MKSIKLGFILLLTLLSFNLVQANSLIRVSQVEVVGPDICIEAFELKLELRDLIKFPNAKWDMKLEGNVEVSVTLDFENKIHVVKISGENHYLVDHVERSLDGKVVDGMIDWTGKVYSTTIEFRQFL